MFLGYQKGILCYIAETREELENLPCITFTDIIETKKQVEMVGNKYYVGAKDIKAAKEELVHAVRNRYLETYVDPVVTNPLRWADLSEEEQQEYKDYRRYLLDYTKQKSWWEQNPLTFDEWKE